MTKIQRVYCLELRSVVVLLNAPAFVLCTPNKSKGRSEARLWIIGNGYSSDRRSRVLRPTLGTVESVRFPLTTSNVSRLQLRCVFTPRRVRGCPSGMYIRSLIQRSEGPFHVRNHWGSSGVLARGFSSDGSLEIAASF